jgi:hypothetical protein
MSELARQLCLKDCQCGHHAQAIKEELEAGRAPQMFREVTVLTCTTCDGLWDQHITDQVVDIIMSGAK